MKILSVETSCDETSLAVVEATGGLSLPRFKTEHHLIASQIAIHRPFGGVVPNLAKREHLKNLPFLYNDLRARGFDISKTDLIAATAGPGLEPALWTGINFAQALGGSAAKPVLGVNHLEGHLYSFLLSSPFRTKRELEKMFPAIVLLVSGGHTMLMRLSSLTEWHILGETLDDAAGEAYDKVARLLGLPYPGGPEIEKIAKKGNPHAVEFPRPMLGKPNYSFSFSGLKTAVLYYVKANARTIKKNPADIAASFQAAVIDVLAGKTRKAITEHEARSLVLVGGVAGNRAIREALGTLAAEKKIPFLVPTMEHNTDNAAMMAVAAYIAHLSGKTYPLKADGSLSLS